MDWIRIREALRERNSIHLLDALGGLAHYRDFLLVRLPKHSVGAELGVYRGDLSRRLLSIVRPKLLYLIDPWRFVPDIEYSRAVYGGPVGDSQVRMDRMYANVCRRFQHETKSGVVTIHRKTSLEGSQSIPDRSLDWVYIDANHKYSFVLDDLETYKSKVRVGGWIAGDNYAEPDGWWEDGVTRAVDEFVARGLAEKVLTARHQFLLRIPDD